jgi:hypothetical protein
MNQRLLSIIAATTLGLAASHASANTVDLTGFTYGPATIATVRSTASATPIAAFSVYAGQYSGLLDGRAFVTYCVELTQSLRFNTTYTDYSVVSGVQAWGAAKSAQFDRLISALFGANVVTDANGSGLAQTAIWETLYETATSNGFTTGTFQAASTDPMITGATAAEWSALASTPIRYHVDLLHSPSAQDLLLITATSVPEPSDAALLLAGLLALGIVAGRRSRHATDAFRTALQ